MVRPTFVSQPKLGSHPSTGTTLVALGLGSSLGARRERLERVVRKLARTPGISLLRTSSWYRTPPLKGGLARGWFLNGVVLLRSTLTPDQLLALCIQLEESEGRRRGLHWGDRTLDMDVLLIANQTVNTPTLEVPHPQMHLRPFVMQPLLEVWPTATRPNGQAFGLDQVQGPRAVRTGMMAKRATAAR